MGVFGLVFVGCSQVSYSLSSKLSKFDIQLTFLVLIAAPDRMGSDHTRSSCLSTLVSFQTKYSLEIPIESLYFFIGSFSYPESLGSLVSGLPRDHAR